MTLELDCDFQEQQAEAGEVLVGGDFDDGGFGEVKPREAFQGGLPHFDAAARVEGHVAEAGFEG